MNEGTAQATTVDATTNAIGVGAFAVFLKRVLSAPIEATGFSSQMLPRVMYEQQVPFTEADRQIARLNSVRDAGPGWAGPGAITPDGKSLDAAVAFIKRISFLPVPIPMASVGAHGNAGLCWSDDKLYADVELFPDGRLGYLLEVKGSPPIDMEEELPESGLPPTMAVAFAAAYLSNER